MTDDPSSQRSAGAATPELRTARRSVLSRLSIVWLVPVLALVISLTVVWQNYADRGPLITVLFDNASGVRAEETQLRYRDVVVGVVEAVRFSEDLDQVAVEIRVDKEIGDYIDDSAQFWVVSAEVSAQGVAGLDTVLGGVYIEGDWDGVAGEPRHLFEGVSSAPLVRYGERGVSFELRGDSVEGLSEGTKIYYRGIEVGQIANLRLGGDSSSVVADGFVREPEARLITTSTRFWDTSGFTFSFGAQGARLDVASIASLVSGGISFATTVSGGEEVTSDTVFRLYEDEESARGSVFADSLAGDPVLFSIVFEDQIQGLEVGADVEFGGVSVGQIDALTGLIDEELFGDREIRLLVTVEIQPGNLGLEGDADEEVVYDFMDFAVRSGLRAQLQSASLLGGLQIGLVQLDEVQTASLDMDADPYPQIPSIPGDVSDFADTAQGVFNRVNNLPIEEVLNNAIALMSSANEILNDEGVRDTPSEVLGILSAVRSLVGSDGVQGLPDQANDLMLTLNDTAQTLQGVVVELQDAGAVTQLVAALDAAEDAANAVFVAVDDFPATLAEIETAVQSLDRLINSVNDLPLQSVVEETEGTIAALRTLLAAPETQGLTGDVSALLTEVEGLIAEIREAGLVETAEATLVDLRATVSNLATELNPLLAEARTAITSARSSIDGVPQLIEGIDTLSRDLSTFVNDLGTLPLSEVVANVDDLIAGIDLLVTRVETQALPGEVTQTLAAARQVMAEIVEGGVLDQATQTLATTENAVQDLTLQLRGVLSEAERAAGSVAVAAESAPEVVARANRIAEDLEELTSEATQIPIEELSARISTLVTSANDLVASQDTQRLPGALADTLEEVQRLLIEVQEGGLVENANQTLASAEQAADAIRRASDELPTLLDSTNALLARTQAVIAGYEANGPLGAQARSTLREVQEAASSIDSLARQIERAPNSLLFGR
ncbi:MlaD family protein [Palleronia sp. LCG004]|uniref:MlaD family protein n=1 Tax=Palleronia sp. LCG004 TaxID=3079304 RepID=UPI002942644F|nr:MlaD family protein [Palleronia sp. LCG004]WOI55615.1 MlaD family protein [Palleronia sp. LCG004]